MAAHSRRSMLILADTASVSLGSFCGLALCYGSAENVPVVPIVIPEPELGNIEELPNGHLRRELAYRSDPPCVTVKIGRSSVTIK